MAKGWKGDWKRHSDARKLGYWTQVSHRQFLFGDFDKDGTSNFKDCRPFDRNKQHLSSFTNTEPINRRNEIELRKKKLAYIKAMLAEEERRWKEEREAMR